MRSDDLDALHEIFAHPDAMRYWDGPPHETVDRTEKLLSAFMRDAPDHHLEFAIDLNDRLIGRVGIWRRYEIGYILHPAFWRQGYAAEAVAALIPAAFAYFPAARSLTAEVDPRNTASCKLLVSQGFRLEWTERANFLYGGAEWCDTAYFRLLRSPGSGV